MTQLSKINTELHIFEKFNSVCLHFQKKNSALFMASLYLQN
jgi:hypothetical protein